MRFESWTSNNAITAPVRLTHQQTAELLNLPEFWPGEDLGRDRAESASTRLSRDARKSRTTFASASLIMTRIWEAVLHDFALYAICAGPGCFPLSGARGAEENGNVADERSAKDETGA